MRVGLLPLVASLALAGFALPADAARVCHEVCSHKTCTHEGTPVVQRERDIVIGRGVRDRTVIEGREHRPGFEVDTPVGGVRVR
jgi:hypothetical protein